MFEIPVDISPDAAGWPITLAVALVFVAIVALMGAGSPAKTGLEG